MTVSPVRMREIDAKYKSPKDRAEHVFRILQKHKITNWDSLCFAVEFMAYQATDPYMSWLEQPARHAAQLLYTMHYEMAENLYSTVEAEDELIDAYGVSVDDQGNYILKIPAKLFAKIFGPAPDPQVDGKYLVCGYFQSLYPSQIEKLSYRRVKDEFWITIYKRLATAGASNDPNNRGSSSQASSEQPDQGVDSSKREPPDSVGALQSRSRESKGYLDSKS